MTYSILYPSGTLTINNLGFDNTSTSLTIVGKDAPQWGQAINQNFINLLSNFASPVAPVTPVLGQLWFNTSTNNLHVWSGSWLIIATQTWLESQGYITATALTNYANASFLAQQNYVTAQTLINEGFVTASYLAAQQYITQSYITSQSYVTQAEVNNSIASFSASSLQSFVTNNFITAQGYVTYDYLSSNYVSVNYLTTQNYATTTQLGSYLTGNQLITVTGDATGSGTTSINLTLANSGVSAGTYTKVVVDTKGLVTEGLEILSSDIISALGFNPLTSANFLLGSGYQYLSSGLIVQWITGSADPADNTTPTQTLNWAIAFPNQLFGSIVSTYSASSTAQSDVWYQIVTSSTNTLQVMVQRQNCGTGTFLTTTTPFIIGIGF